MRTLLIDNYDSFTFNVAQALAGANGVEPIVIKNDAMTYDELARLDFDNIVISPGPGTPGNARDFGVCGDVVRYASCPILGVCMGFQGIALLSGARVMTAPEPCHGRGNFINHDGGDLFEGVPSPFFGIRYHSLHVPSLAGTDLAPTAWTDDGVLMGFRHRTRPLWGVQFHPESVATEHGRRIFENFRDLSLGRVTPPARRSLAAAPPSEASDRAPDAAVREVRFRKLTDVPDPEAVFASLFAGSDRAFWLDSGAALSARARFSYMGDAPEHALIYRSRARRLEIASPAGRRVVDASVFDHLKAALGRERVEAGGLPFDFCGGYIGYLGYELKGECGGDYRHASDAPDAWFVRVLRFVAFDHASGECYVVAVGDRAGDDRWIREITDRIRAAAARPAPIVSPSRRTDPNRAAFRLEQERAEYMSRIDTALEKIRQGESYQVCLTNRARCRFDGEPFGLYRVLRRRNPAPFSAFLSGDGVSVLCTSPERFLRVGTDGSVEARPIKGTAPRLPDAEPDVRSRETLLHSEKNRSENLMIADLLRNDLGRTAETGSVHVPSLMALESYQTVHHLVSTVQSKLGDGFDAIDCIRAAFPGGSMTGAPKIRTMEILDGLESSARGVYSGALGYLSLTGAVDLNIVIRTMVIANGTLGIGMGGGIVALSDAAEEFDEAMLKAEALMDAVDAYLASAAGGRGEPVRDDVGSTE